MRGVRRGLIGALLAVAAWGAARSVAYVATDLRAERARLARAAPELLYGPHAALLTKARRRIPAAAAVGVSWQRAPHLFAYYLHPRPVYARPELASDRPPWKSPPLASREIRWWIGNDVLRAPGGPPGGQGRSPAP